MFEYLYEWLRNISYYLVLVTAVTYALPSNTYRKYIRFFTGLVLIIMLLSPIFDLSFVKVLVEDEALEKYIVEYENHMPNEIVHNKEIQIEVEDIVIGP